MKSALSVLICDSDKLSNLLQTTEDLEKVKEIIKQKVDPKKVKLLKNKKHF